MIDELKREVSLIRLFLHQVNLPVATRAHLLNDVVVQSRVINLKEIRVFHELLIVYIAGEGKRLLLGLPIRAALLAVRHEVVVEHLQHLGRVLLNLLGTEVRFLQL